MAESKAYNQKRSIGQQDSPVLASPDRRNGYGVGIESRPTGYTAEISRLLTSGGFDPTFAIMTMSKHLTLFRPFPIAG
jgi:hypothetical protein